MKKLLLMIPLMIVLVLSLTLTSFASTSSPSSGEYPVYAPSQAPLQFSFAVGDYPKTEGLQIPTKYNLFMDVGSPVVSSGTTYSNIKLWNNSLGIQYSFRTAVSVGDGVNGLSLSKGTDIDKLNTIYPEFSATGKSFIYDPDLVQGFYRPIGLSYDTSLVPSNDLIHQRVVYEGSVLYPTTDGSYIPLPFYFEDELYSGASQTVNLYEYVRAESLDPDEILTVKKFLRDYPVATNFGCSLVPARLSYNGNADKLGSYFIFNLVKDNADKLGISNLISPSVLVENDVPVVFNSYSMSYIIEGATVHRITEGLGADYPVNRFFNYGDVTCSGLNVTLPSTLDGIPRDNETLEDFIYKVFPESPDFEFSVISFLTSIIVGVLSVELFPGFFLYTAVSVVVAISLIIWLLKVFAGG